MPGAATFLLLNSDPTEAAIIFDALKLDEKQLVLFAVNDNPDVEWAAGGAHWSCLAYHRATNTFRHYDSSAPHNSRVARRLADAAAPLVQSRGDSSSNSSSAMFPLLVEVAATPQQKNSNDCGVYVLAVARELCSSLAHAQQQHGSAAEACWWRLSDEQETELLQQITPAGVANMREELLSVISSLADHVPADESANGAAAAAAACRGEMLL
ncbi:hypothetical protein COO60DRAFT_533362 [Scenedesmus sp. NREL 46B-D3]|nr:hypothetical protein COO60DRAFT_533362 [Scenedesmus sp. NREL 46B-D3]